MITCQDRAVKQNTLTVTIETPEHIELQFKVAGIGTRFLAYLLDRLIQAGLIFALFLAVLSVLFVTGQFFSLVELAQGLKRTFGQWVLALGFLLYGVISIGYFILFEYIWSGSTPGKRSQNIRVIRTDGGPISFLDSSIRNILRVLDILADVYPLGLIVMFVDSRNRRLGDMAAGTMVVLESLTNIPASRVIRERPDENDQELRSVIARMTPEDYQLLARFLARRESVELEHRDELVDEIVLRIFGSVAIVPGSRIARERLLEKMEALYRQRLRVL
jgi:uncharacterized RDD family membrane protein YckC